MNISSRVKCSAFLVVSFLKIKYIMNIKCGTDEKRTSRKESNEMSDTVKKKISIGVEDFKEIIDKDGYFVDKTLMIKKLIESGYMKCFFV